MARLSETQSTVLATALILAAVVAGWTLMPKVMQMVSGGGPVAGATVAILFMLAFFAVLWLRARHQRRIHKD